MKSISLFLDIAKVANFWWKNTYLSKTHGKGNVSFVFFVFSTLSLPEKLKNSIYEMPIIPQTLNINNLRTTNAKSINLNTIRKLIKYSLKKIRVKAMFTTTIFEMLLFVGKTVLSPTQRDTGSERVNVPVKNQKNLQILLKLLEKWLAYKLMKFWVVFHCFWFYLTLSLPKKLEKLICEMPVVPQTLNINNMRTTNAKSISLHTIRKLIKYSLKKVMFTLFTLCKGNVYSYRFWDVTIWRQNWKG